MRCVLALAVLGAASIPVVVAPSGSGSPDESDPDGLLVLGVVSRYGGLMREHAVVADPRTGQRDIRQLEGGALCHGPVLAVGDRVLASGSRGHHPVVLSFRLDVRGRPRVVAAGDQFVRSGSPGRLWVARTESSWRKRSRPCARSSRAAGPCTACAAASRRGARYRGRSRAAWSSREGALSSGGIQAREGWFAACPTPG